MITRIPRSSFSANINNTAQTNEHQTLSELFYKELEDKFSGKELATPLLKSFSENCRQNGRHIFSNKDFVIKFSTSVLQADKGNDSNLLIVFYVQIMPDDFVMQLHRF